MTDQEIAAEIAKLMGPDWMQPGALMFPLDRIVGRAGSQLVIFGSVICGEDTVDVYDTSHCRSDTPDINDPATRGVIEGWCRDRGYHLHYWSRGWDVVQVVEHDQHLVYIAKPHKEALLEGVRLAAEVEND